MEDQATDKEPIKTARPDIDTYFMSIAEATARRSTCRHRAQGVVLVRDRRIIATGYNGSPPGMLHCIDLDCAKAYGAECRAEGLHGETNAIISAARMGISTGNATAYCIFSPCLACCNMLTTAGISAVVFKEVYPSFPDGPKYLRKLGILSYKWSERGGVEQA